MRRAARAASLCQRLVVAVVSATTRNTNTLIVEKVCDSVLRVDAPRPSFNVHVFERLGFAETVPRITSAVLNKVSDLSHRLPVCVPPGTVIGPANAIEENTAAHSEICLVSHCNNARPHAPRMTHLPRFRER
jgi:hypothetical protein